MQWAAMFGAVLSNDNNMRSLIIEMYVPRREKRNVVVVEVEVFHFLQFSNLQRQICDSFQQASDENV
eukprot:762669-Hanusia_phi.AAC.4